MCSEGTPHRKGGVEVRGLRLCGVPSERGFFCWVDSQGLHPGLVCDAPLGHGLENVVAGLAPTEPRRPVGTRCPCRAWDWKRGGCPVSESRCQLALTEPRRPDGTRYPLGHECGLAKEKAVPAGCRNGLSARAGRRVRLYFLAAFLATFLVAFLAAFLAGAALASARFSSMAAWAAARRATGTRYGLHET